MKIVQFFYSLGGHINPAVTLCFALFGRLKWRYVPVYIIAQYIGAFLAAFCVYIVYYSKSHLPIGWKIENKIFF